MAKEGLPVQTACCVLEVSESGFYEWRNRAPSDRSLRYAWLTQLITEVHVASTGTCGARRVRAELTLGYGIAVGHGCVELLMRAAGVKGLPGNVRVRSIRPRPRAISWTASSPATSRTSYGSRTLPNIPHLGFNRSSQHLDHGGPSTVGSRWCGANTPPPV